MADKFKDLCVKIDDSILKIRALILLHTPKGYIFEISKRDYYFALGGIIKIGETGAEACSREIFEEIGLKGVEVKLSGLIENFFTIDDGSESVHELNLVFKGKLDYSPEIEKIPSDNGNKGFKYIKESEVNDYDIKPVILKKLIYQKGEFVHLVNRD